MLRYQVQIFFLALGFLTRVRVPPDPDFSEQKLNRCARYFPLVGLLIGVIVAIFTTLCVHLFSPPIAVMLGMVASLLLTGAFHEDGLADSVDGLGGGLTSQRMLDIMKDSRLGTYGSCALFTGLALKWACLSTIFSRDLSEGVVALILAHSLSRLAPLWLMSSLPYAGDRGNSKSKPLARALRVDDLLIAHLTGLIPLFILNRLQTSLCLLLAIPVTLLWRAKLKRKIGGYTGDTLGAAQQLVELSCYLVVVSL